MAKQAKEVLGVEEIKVLADKGYYSTKDLIKYERNPIETYVGPTLSQFRRCLWPGS
ncbi:hypothetical protein ASZ90_019593 [hydrocarbon metagenome]|uniref:Uncharacterized protein n=1 Tax=hydrocarbon metagenome TaxID=938273 RepID=A0A0W8E340_9ZZZZ